MTSPSVPETSTGADVSPFTRESSVALSGPPGFRRRAIALAVLVLLTSVVPWTAWTQTAPRLGFAASPGGGIELSWEASPASAFALEESPVLGANATWLPVSPAPQAAGSRFSTLITPTAAQRYFRLRRDVPTAVAETSPFHGERGVAVTRETILRLDGALQSGAVPGPNDLYAMFGGRRLLSRASVSSDARTLTLFYLENLPAGARIRVTLEGDGLLDRSGRALDADRDGIPGGRLDLEFDTFATAALANTGVEGRVFASEKNPDGSNRPLVNVTITVDGAEETLRTTTDATGYFRLLPSPSGRFFVHIDGRTAEGSRWPGGEYYPFLGKAWDAVPGRPNNLAGGTGEIFLPLIPADALRPVSAATATTVELSDTVLAEHPEWAGLQVTIPPNALFADNGVRGGRVGLAAVPPDRLPEPLPAGLRISQAVTIQTDGGLNFDVPVPIRFPNLPDPTTGVRLAAGQKTILWSFNHDTGRWEPQGSMTVSADGNFIESDPGVGVRQPGWSAPSAPGVAGSGPGRRGSGGGAGGPGFPGSGSGGGGGRDKEECLRTIACSFPQPERRWLNCLLKCARDILGNPFSDDIDRKRSPIATGLRCIGGPDRCAGRSDDTLTPAQRACMDACQNPEPLRKTYVVPCEGGFLDPCPEPSSAGGLSLHGQQSLAAVTDADLLPDRLEEQRRFWEVEADFIAKQAGTTKILQMVNADLPKLHAFTEALAARIQPTSPAGVRLSAEERAFLVALPRPVQFNAAEWAALVDRFDALQAGPLPADVAAAQARLDNLIALLEARGWTRRLDGFVQGYERLSQVRAPEFGSPEFPARAHYFLLRNLDDGIEQRGRLSAAGILQSQVLPPETVHTIAYYDPVTGLAGAALFETGPSGTAVLVPTASFEAFADGEFDTDGDRLPDAAEEIIGTDPAKQDTDGDGVPDGVEVENDAYPLDGIAESIGFLARVTTPFGAHGLKVDHDLAVVRSDQGGLTAIDLSDSLSPVVVGSLHLNEMTLSLDFDWPHALVGAGARTVLVDFSTPSAPVLRWARPVPGYAVALAFGRAYVAGNDSLVAFDLETGEPVESARHAFKVHNLRTAGGRLIALTALPSVSFELLDLADSGDRIVPRGNLPIECGGCAGGLVAEADYAYINTVFGYLVADIRLPLSPSWLTSPGSALIGGGTIEKDGGGRVASVHFPAAGIGAQRFGFYDASNPRVASNLVGGFEVFTGTVFDHALYRGRLLAAVSDTLDLNRGSLEVYAYRARDTGTNPPSGRLQAFSLRADPPAEQSLGWFRMSPLATDDVCVRNVEYYLDGRLVADVGSHPFETGLRAPERTASKTNFVVRARLFDTAGNSAWTDPLTLALLPEMRPPRLTAFTPGDGTLVLTGGVVDVSATFNEPLVESSLTAGIRVVSVGADALPGTADDVAVPATVAAQVGNRYRLQLDQPLPIGRYAVTATTNLADAAGNRLANPTQWTFEVRGPVLWMGGSGSWTDTARWSARRLPATNDFVRIDTGSSDEVLMEPGAAGVLTAHDLHSANPMQWRNGAGLRLGDQARFDAPVRIGRPGIQQVEADVEGGSALFAGGLELHGGWSLRDHAAVLDSKGALSTFHDAALVLASYIRGVGSSVTFHPGTTVQVRHSAVSTATWNLSDALSSVENRGELRKLGGGTLRVHGAGRLVNQGLLQVSEGGLNVVATEFVNHGVLAIETGATFVSGGISPGARHSRTAQITGTGTNHLNGRSVFENEYGFPGTTIVEGGEKKFLGGIRNSGAWVVTGNPMTIRGLFADFGGRVRLGGTGPGQAGRIEFRMAGDALLRDVEVLQAVFTGNGRVRFLSPLTVSNLFAVPTAAGPFTLRFESALHLAGRAAGNAYFQAAGPPVRVEFADRVLWDTGPAQLETNAVVLPGAVFTVEGSALTEVRGDSAAAGLTVRGTYRKSGTGTNRIQRLVNAGLVVIEGGSVQSLLSSTAAGFVQDSGELRLAGGTLDVRRGNEASTLAGQIDLRGGRLTGSGRVTGDVSVPGGTIAPGSASAPGILEVVGRVFLESAAIIRVKVGGTTPGSQHDQLRAETVDFDGRLEVQRGEAYLPALGDEFEIARFMARSARGFREVTGLEIGSGRRFEVIYQPNAVKLRVVPQ